MNFLLGVVVIAQLPSNYPLHWQTLSRHVTNTENLAWTVGADSCPWKFFVFRILHKTFNFVFELVFVFGTIPVGNYQPVFIDHILRMNVS